MATFYLDPDGGNDANDGTTFANRWKTVTLGATTARIAPGDIIRLMASPAPTSLGTTGIWTNKSKTVTLGAALTAHVDRGEAAWTASANVTAATSTTRKEGATSASLAIAAGFTTGKVAYKTIASTDYSAYRQISLWIRTDVALATAGQLELRLCSDTIGDVAVDTFAIPAINATGVFLAFTVNKGSALGSAIQSVALWAPSIDPGAPTILLDNIIALKDSAGADALALTSLIGKSTAGETFWPIQSIDGVTVLIDNSPAEIATQGRGYSGVTETVTTYHRTPVMRDEAATEAVQDSGTAGNLITFSGGWNRTDMSTQTGETWWRPLRIQSAFQFNGRNYIRLENFVSVSCPGVAPGGIGFNSVSLGCELHNVSVIGSAGTGFLLPAASGTQHFIFTGDCLFVACQGAGMGGNILLSSGPLFQPSGTMKFLSNLSSGAASFDSRIGSVFLKDVYIANGGNEGIRMGGLARIEKLVIKDCAGIAVATYLSMGNIRIFDLQTSGNTGSAVVGVGVQTIVAARNAVHGEATIVTFASPVLKGVQEYRVERYGGVVDDHRVFSTLGSIRSETGADRHTASGIAWKLSPTDADLSSVFPFTLQLAKVAVNASALVTVRAFMKRSNTALTGKLFCRGGQLAGVASDVSASVSAAADTYEELTITFTPTENGVIEIEAHAFGGTTHSLFVDDMTIIQA